MNKIANIALTALVTTTALVATSRGAEAQNVDPGHMALGQAIVSTGVQLKINPKECFAGDNTAMGWYWAAKNEMVVCQENATRANTEVNWTAEDFDTLRHEAVHLVQDASVGLDNESAETFGNWKSLVPDLSADHVYAIENFYPQEQWGLEVEARTLETEPEIVTNLVKKFVF